MDNGNDPPTRIPFLEISDKNTIPTNSGLSNSHASLVNQPLFS